VIEQRCRWLLLLRTPVVTARRRPARCLGAVAGRGRRSGVVETGRQPMRGTMVRHRMHAGPWTAAIVVVPPHPSTRPDWAFKHPARGKCATRPRVHARAARTTSRSLAGYEADTVQSGRAFALDVSIAQDPHAAQAHSVTWTKCRGQHERHRPAAACAYFQAPAQVNDPQ